MLDYCYWDSWGYLSVKLSQYSTNSCTKIHWKMSPILSQHSISIGICTMKLHHPKWSKICVWPKTYFHATLWKIRFHTEECGIDPIYCCHYIYFLLVSCHFLWDLIQIELPCYTADIDWFQWVSIPTACCSKWFIILDLLVTVMYHVVYDVWNQWQFHSLSFSLCRRSKSSSRLHFTDPLWWETHTNGY